jgi:TolA-binding protein
MSKDGDSGLPDLGPDPETQMSEEMLASRSPFQAALLAAGRADGLAPGRKEKLFRNLSIAVGAPDLFGPPDAAGAGNTAGASNAGHELGNQAQLAGQSALKVTAKAAAMEGLAAKVVGAVAISGALVWGGYQAFVASSSAPSSVVGVVEAPVDAREDSPAGVPPVVETKPVVAGPLAEQAALDQAALDEVATGAVKGARSRAKAADSDSLAKELSLIDSARAALLRGEPAAALRILNTYRSQFPRGALQAEATVQRVEALIATGDRASASKIGGGFLKRHPESPYSRRILSLLGGREAVDAARKSK